MNHANRIVVLMAVAFSAAAACNKTGPQPNAGMPAASGAYGSVDGRLLTAQAFPDEVQTRLRDAQNEAMQRELHLTWVGVRQAARQMVLNAAAQKRGMSRRALRQKEIIDQVTKPTDDEVRTFYNENQESIRVPFEDAKDLLRESMYEQRIETREEVFFSKVQDEHEVQIDLPAPTFPRYPVEAGNAPTWGDTSAPVTIVAFSDFECPYCGRARGVLDKLKTLYPDKLKIVFRDFPLNQHPNAFPAAIASECAHQQGAFWDYHDKLFDNMRALQQGDLVRYAKELELDQDAFESCQKAAKTRLAVERDVDAGREIGVKGTPAIFINGIKLIGLLPTPLLRVIIDGELARSGGEVG